MTEFERIYDFQNLYKAHKAARRGKRDKQEVIDFELNLAENLTKISDAIKEKTYKMSGYYSFFVHEPKEREINALHYIDRVVQHCICDEVLSETIEKKLIYDNAACRKGKGTHFALKRAVGFLRSFYNKNGTDGYFLKCDIRKFFNNIDHNILKEKLMRVFDDENVLWLLFMIIDSFEVSPGKGLPMGNQTSQWFAVYYLDGLDRLIKEQLRIKFYSRYMDDCVLIHRDKKYLQQCLEIMRRFAKEELELEFNEKTQIFPIRNGVEYLGWHIYLSETGKVIKKVRRQTKIRYKRYIKHIEYAYTNNLISKDEIQQTVSSYKAHLSFGHTYKLQKKADDKINSLLNKYI